MITYKDRIISTGYVGSKPGKPHCIDEGCIIDEETSGCIRTDHAEENAIRFIKDTKYNTGELKIFTTLSPCVNCAKLIIYYKIQKVVYLTEYRKRDGIIYLKENNVQVEQYIGRII